MQHGDLSNEVEPRAIVVFENLLGVHPTKKDHAAYIAAKRVHQWKRALNTYKINWLLVGEMNRLWKQHYSLDVVTFMDPRIGDFLEDFIDYQDIPVGRVFTSTPEVLVHGLLYRQNVRGVYYPADGPSQAMRFGGKGIAVNPSQPSMVHF